MPHQLPNAKLYDYLKGYETVGFTGSSKATVLKSLVDLIELESEMLQINPDLLQPILSVLKSDMDLFLTKFYDRMHNQKDHLKVPLMAEKAKADSSALSALVSLLLSGANCPMEDCFFSPLAKAGEVDTDHAIDLSINCPYYVKNKFCMIYSLESDDNIYLEAIRFQLPEYKYLARACLRLFHFLLKELGVGLQNIIQFHMIFQYLITASKVYELMNPTGSARQVYIDSALECLTQEPLDRSSEKYQYYLGVLHDVFQDIRAGDKPYIQDISNALQRSDEFVKSKYKPSGDDYLSMKGTAQKKNTRVKYSLVSSAFEIDQYADQFKLYDDFVHFESHYRSHDDTDQKIMSVRTILINNPGKFKPRIIHIFDNPLQDRCNYIHRRLQAILDGMDCDCTRHQDDGRTFLKNVTLEWAVSRDIEKPGVYCFDFSNATDTLDQGFQGEVLNFIFGPEVAHFWDQVSKLDKFIQFSDGSYHRYTQHCGQPQGGLGSFPAFALAHHFIFLMDMKLLGFEDRKPTEFYRVLGDDSVSTSMDPEIDFFDPNDPWIDGDGIPRSSIEELHFDICQEFAGFKINFSKSESAHWTSQEAKLDFAKVTFRNGILFTAIPFRLAMNFSKSYNSQLAVAIWRGERNDPKARSFMDLILKRSPSPDLAMIVKSGIVPFLDPFKEPGLMLNPSWESRVKYACALSHLTNGLTFMSLTDSERADPRGDTFTRAFSSLFSDRQMTALDSVDPNHKVFRVIEENYQILELLSRIYEEIDPDERFWILACSPLGEDTMSGPMFDCLYDLAKTNDLLRKAKANPAVDVSQVFPDFDMKFMRSLQQLSGKFLTRGITKKPREEAMILRNILDIMEAVSDILGSIPESGVATAYSQSSKKFVPVFAPGRGST